MLDWLANPMAHSFNRLYARHTPEQAFDFIADFRHASLWDPRTQSVRKLTEGPIGRGTRFLLTAGLLGQSLEFPYEIVEYDRATQLVFAGKTRFFEYRERVSFHPEQGGTRIEYRAEMCLRSLLLLGNPILSLIYQRIGDDATSGIVPALDRALAA
ncbi:MAG TPA: SRPBCC family protein [Polyangiales bacterium]|nr:SRPBCC family protein [Polyangiales bacterium]